MSLQKQGAESGAPNEKIHKKLEEVCGKEVRGAGGESLTFTQSLRKKFWMSLSTPTEEKLRDRMAYRRGS